MQPSGLLACLWRLTDRRDQLAGPPASGFALDCPPIGSRLKISVLGGSTPFTVAFADAAAQAPWSVPIDVVLHGRRGDHLELVGLYARRRLACIRARVTWTIDLGQALEGAGIVLHQIRYGGPEGRIADEGLAHGFDLPADETLGPAALSTAIRMAPELARTAEAIRRYCPSAIVVNLANPLACSTALLWRQGVRTIGICELPLVTVLDACRALGVPDADVHWRYVGFNHRGFVYTMRQESTDLIPLLSRVLRCTSGSLNGISPDEIDELGALPTKYFALWRGDAKAGSPRAAFVERVRRRALEELARDTTRCPPSLAARQPVWYEAAVVPALAALSDPNPSRLVLNVPMGGVVREVHGELSSRSVTAEPPDEPPPALMPWLKRFEAHELHTVMAALDPSAASVRGALERDPVVPAPLVDAVTRRLLLAR